MRNYLFLFLYLLLALCAPVNSDAQNISTIAGIGSYAFSGDGSPATVAEFEYIWYVAMDAAGSVYFTDNANHRIRKIDPAGIIHTIAGQGYAGFSADGTAATAALISGPAGITVDGSGNVYFAEPGNHRIRKIDASGILTTVAGTGVTGYTGDGSPATNARLNAPRGIYLAAGNLFMADYSSNCVRKIDASGIISTVAGTGIGGFSGDGSAATAAKLSSPGSVAVDNLGNLYIADVLNNRVRVVDASGTIHTLAGTGVAGFFGDGGAATSAKINQPMGVAVDELGNVAISDQLNHRIRKVDPTGMITTIAGTGVAGYSGDGIPATTAKLNSPFGVSVDSVGNVYICDRLNMRMRKISQNDNKPFFTAGVTDSIAICENDGPTAINALLTASDADAGQTLTWTPLSGPVHGTAVVSFGASSTGAAITPSGLTYIPVTGYSGYDTFTVRVDDGFTVDTITISVRIKPLPGLSPIVGAPVACIGTPVPFTDTASGGTWISSNGSATIDATGLLSGVYNGVDTIYYTKTTEGCISLVSTVVSVYPVTDSIDGLPVVCIHSAILLTGIPAGGTWSEVNGYTSVSSGGLVIGIVPGEDTIIYTVTNPCGTSTYQKIIHVNDLVAPSVIVTGSPGAFIVAGSSDTLVANIIGGPGYGYSYQWQVNGNDVLGATDSTFICDTLSNHDSVTCIVSNGPCSASSFGWIFIVYVRAGIGAMNVADADIKVLPNPASGAFTISGTFPFEEENVTLEVTNILGQTIYKEVCKVESGVLKKRIYPDEHFTDGIYLLHIITPYGQKVEQFVMSR
jgi:hypothetical protein